MPTNRAKTKMGTVIVKEPDLVPYLLRKDSDGTRISLSSARVSNSTIQRGHSRT